MSSNNNVIYDNNLIDSNVMKCTESEQELLVDEFRMMPSSCWPTYQVIIIVHL